jgi:hypothetical protein
MPPCGRRFGNELDGPADRLFPDRRCGCHFVRPLPVFPDLPAAAPLVTRRSDTLSGATVALALVAKTANKHFRPSNRKQGRARPPTVPTIGSAWQSRSAPERLFPKSQKRSDPLDPCAPSMAVVLQAIGPAFSLSSSRMAAFRPMKCTRLRPPQ